MVCMQVTETSSSRQFGQHGRVGPVSMPYNPYDPIVIGDQPQSQDISTSASDQCSEHK